MTQECIDFMAENNIVQKTEMINSLQEMNCASKEIIKGNSSGVRYVIDMEKLFS